MEMIHQEALQDDDKPLNRKYYRMYRSDIDKKLFAVCQSDKEDNPILLVKNGLTFDQASALIEQIKKKQVTF
jgi:hypothetical protein